MKMTISIDLSDWKRLHSNAHDGVTIYQTTVMSNFQLFDQENFLTRVISS